MTVRWVVAPDFWTCSEPPQAASVPRTVASATGPMRRMVVAVMRTSLLRRPRSGIRGRTGLAPETSVPTLNPVACVCQVGEDRDMRWVRWLALCRRDRVGRRCWRSPSPSQAARRPAEAVGDGGAGAARAPGRRGGRALGRGPASGAAAAGTRLRVAAGRRRPGSAGGRAAATARPAARCSSLLALALGLTAPALAGAAALLHPTPAHRRDPTSPAPRWRRRWLRGSCRRCSSTRGPRAASNARAICCSSHGDAGLHDALLRDGLWVSAVACAVVAGAAALGLARRPALVRRVAAPVVVPALVAAGLGAAMLAHDARAGSPALDATTRALWLLLCAALLLAAAGWLRGRARSTAAAARRRPRRRGAARRRRAAGGAGRGARRPRPAGRVRDRQRDARRRRRSVGRRRPPRASQ